MKARRSQSSGTDRKERREGGETNEIEVDEGRPKRDERLEQARLLARRVPLQTLLVALDLLRCRSVVSGRYRLDREGVLDVHVGDDVGDLVKRSRAVRVDVVSAEAAGHQRSLYPGRDDAGEVERNRPVGPALDDLAGVDEVLDSGLQGGQKRLQL